MQGILGLIPSASTKHGQDVKSLRQTALGYQRQECCCKFEVSLSYTEFPAGEGYRVRPCLKKKGRVELGDKGSGRKEERRKPSHTATGCFVLSACSCTWGGQRTKEFQIKDRARQSYHLHPCRHHRRLLSHPRQYPSGHYSGPSGSCHRHPQRYLYHCSFGLYCESGHSCPK